MDLCRFHPGLHPYLSWNIHLLDSVQTWSLRCSVGAYLVTKKDHRLDQQKYMYRSCPIFGSTSTQADPNGDTNTKYGPFNSLRIVVYAPNRHTNTNHGMESSEPMKTLHLGDKHKTNDCTGVIHLYLLARKETTKDPLLAQQAIFVVIILTVVY